MGALACMGLVSRRLQQSTKAYAHGADAPSGPVQNTSLAAPPPLTWCHQRCDRTQVVSVDRRQSMNTCERERKHTQPAPAPVQAPRLLQFWSEVFLAVPLVMVMRVRELERRAGEAASPFAMTSPMVVVDRTFRRKGTSWHRSEEIFSFAVSAVTFCVVFWWFDQWATAKIVT